MKKIFTLALASLMTVALFAADRRPSVTLTAAKRYEVVIDGTSYASGIGNTMNVALLNRNQHTIKVYELKAGLFSKQRRLVSATTFRMNRNDMAISVNRMGQISIQEQRDYRNGGWDNKGKQDRNDDRNDRNDHRKF